MKRTCVLIVWVLAGCGPSIATDDGDVGWMPGTTSAGGETGGGSLSTASASEGSTTEGEATSLPPPDGSTDTASDCLLWVHEGCPLEGAAMGSLVHGGTPLGEFDLLPFAFFAAHSWCDWCVERVNVERVLFVADPGMLKDLHPWEDLAEGLELEMLGFEGPTGQDLTGILVARRDGESASTRATFSIDALPSAEELAEPFDPGSAVVVSGELLASGNGWSIHGRFWAPYCPALNNYAICE